MPARPGDPSASARRGSSRGNSGSKPRVYNRTVPTFGDIVSHGLFPVGEGKWTVGNIKDEVAVEITPTGGCFLPGGRRDAVVLPALERVLTL